MLGILLAIAAAGCGGGGGAADPDGGAGMDGTGVAGGTGGVGGTGGIAGTPSESFQPQTCAGRSRADVEARRGRTCGQTRECGDGLHCDLAAGGVCAFACVADSDCGQGESCSCAGRCIPARTTLDECRRRPDLLDSAEGLDRVCSADDQCLAGSHCDRELLRCRFQCLRDGDCPAGGRCGCDGRCAAPPARTDDLPVLVLSPSVIELPLPPGVQMAPALPSFGRRPVEVEVTGAVAQASALPPIRVEAGRHLRVRCAQDASPARSCLVQGFARARGDTGTTARWQARVWVESAAETEGEDDGARTWNLRFSSAGLGNSPQALTVLYREFADAVAPGQWERTFHAVRGGYAGLVRLTPPDGNVISLPVRALVNEAEVVLHDETRVLSSSGLLVLAKANGVTRNFRWYENARAGARTSGFTTAYATTTSEAVVHPVTRAVRGEFSLTIVGSLNASQNLGVSTTWQGSFDLLPSTSVSACGGCPQGSTCNLGFCTTGPVHAVPSSFASTLGSGILDTWLPAARKQAIAANPSLGPGHFLCARGNLDSAYVTPLNDIAHVDLTSGDLRCAASSAPPRAFAALTSTVNNASTLLRACLDDVQRASPSLGGGALYDTLGGASFFQDRTCVSLGHFLAALESARRPFYMADYGYLLSQWLRVHTFIARQGLAEQALDDVLRGGATNNQSINAPPLETLLDVLEAAWGLVAAELRGRPDGSLAEWGPPLSLAFPDYRVRYVAASVRTHAAFSNPGFEQLVGLPPIILEAGAAYLDLLTRYLEARAFATYSSQTRATELRAALDRYADGMRMAGVMQALAQRLLTRAVEGCREAGEACGAGNRPPWQRRFELAQERFAAARAEAIVRAELLRQGRNPLGVEDDDVPLYFGDVQGSVSRFFAASSYLLAGAESAVADTKAALAQARDAWNARRTAAVQDQLNATQRDARIADLERGLGQPVLDACGLTMTARELWQTVESGTFHPQSCHITPACANRTALLSPQGLQEQLASRLDERAVKLQLCRIGLLSRRLTVTDGIRQCIGAGTSTRDQLYGLLDTLIRLPLETVSRDSAVTCGMRTFPVSELWQDQGLTMVPAEELAEAQAACEARFGGIEVPQPAFSADCYRGQLGAAAARIAIAQQEVRAALSRLQTAEVSFDKKQELCALKIDNETQRLAARRTVEQQRAAWREGKKLARDIESVATSLQGVMSGAAAGAAIGSAGGPIGAIGGGILGGALGFVGSRASVRQRRLDDQLRLAEAEYQGLVENLRAKEDVLACLMDAEVQRSAVRAEIEVVRTQALAVDAALVDYANVERALYRALNEGRATLQTERQRAWGGLAHHYWFDEKVQTFQRLFPWAKRLTYLALRAAEYELQQTLVARGQVLSATHPDQLDAGVMAVRQNRDNLRVAGGRPEQSAVVLSLRDNVLGLRDTGTGAGEPSLAAGRRFGWRLAGADAAIYDERGRYLGQGFHFSLTPDMRGLALTTLPSRCAERLWQVGATLAGDGIAQGTTRVPVQVRKRNTFFSRLCGLSAGVQSASIQPASNLLKPGLMPMSDQVRVFTEAAIMAPLNVPRATFEADGFAEGLTAELAGYGLYGDYVAYIPAPAIAGGLRVEQVEDILLRVNLLSVAK